MNFMIYRLGELFCGPGGLAYGAINADIGDKNTKIIHAWANDIDKTTCQTFAINELRECQKFCVSPIKDRATTTSATALTQKNLHNRNLTFSKIFIF